MRASVRLRRPFNRSLPVKMWQCRHERYVLVILCGLFALLVHVSHLYALSFMTHPARALLTHYALVRSRARRGCLLRQAGQSSSICGHMRTARPCETARGLCAFSSPTTSARLSLHPPSQRQLLSHSVSFPIRNRDHAQEYSPGILLFNHPPWCLFAVGFAMAKCSPSSSSFHHSSRLSPLPCVGTLMQSSFVGRHDGR